MQLASNPPACILDAAALGKTIWRLGNEIAEKHHGSPVVLAGVPTRGVPLAERLTTVVEPRLQAQVTLISLDIRPFRDDRHTTEAPQSSRFQNLNNGVDVTIDDAIVIVVDDVLFTGRTCRAALDALIHAGRPRAVEILALVDRGHRQLPLKANYVGKNIPSALNQRVNVRLMEVDDADGVWLDSL